MEWIAIKSDDDLPREGKYVLGRHNRGTWRDDTDPDNVNCVVVKLIRGISLEERKMMKSGGITVKQNGSFFINQERSKIFLREDEHGNNLVPYIWDTFGPEHFFGQEITEYAIIPKTINYKVPNQ